MDQAQSIGILEPDSDFESTLLAALPSPSVSTEADHKKGFEQKRRPLFPVLGMGLATAAAVLVGFMLRDIIPGAEEPVVVTQDMSQDLGELEREIAARPAAFGEPFNDYLGDSRNVFMQLASLEGVAPDKEIPLIGTELDVSRIEPRTQSLLRAAQGINLKRKQDVVSCLQSANNLIRQVKIVVDEGDTGPRTVQLVRIAVIDSQILDTIDSLRNRFDVVGTIELVEDEDHTSMEEMALFAKAKKLLYEGDFIGSNRIFGRYCQRFPGSSFWEHGKYFECLTAANSGNVENAVRVIRLTGDQLLSGQIKVGLMGGEILEWREGLKGLDLRVQAHTVDGNVEIGHSLQVIPHISNHAIKDHSFIFTSKSEKVMTFIQPDSEHVTLLKKLAELWPSVFDIRLTSSADDEQSLYKMGVDGEGFRLLLEDPRFKAEVQGAGIEMLFQFHK